MSNVWSFGPAEDDSETYTDGTTVPHRKQVVLLNGKAVGEIEIHMHRRGGPDKEPDLSYGLTAVTYGPLPPGKDKPDTW